MFLEQANEEQLVYVRQVLNEDVNTRDRDLQAIKDWLRKEPHLPDTWDEDALLAFLRGCSFSLEKTKRKLDMYFTVRAVVPEFFTNREVNSPDLQHILRLGSVAIMPGLTPDFRRVSVARALAIDFDTPDLNHFFKLVFMIGDVRIKTEDVGILGDIYVLDASVAVFKHFTKVSPMAIKKFFVCVQEAYPVKVKEVHIINATPFVDFVIKQVSFFLKEKIRRRIMVHPTVDSLLEFVPREMLPEEFGGTAGKMQKYSDQWIRMLQEYEPWFREQERVLADESKRPGPPKCHEDLFGLNGSFKQLAID
ncbi:hypothetical protein MTP99_004275 [Tenebrio molitor]|nr:hypothetical protein MTP99_004275 [Tenebrio molitor]